MYKQKEAYKVFVQVQTTRRSGKMRVREGKG